jgi:hypothetical protein
MPPADATRRAIKMNRTDSEVLEDWDQLHLNKTNKDYERQIEFPPDNIIASYLCKEGRNGATIPQLPLLELQSRCTSGDACKAHSGADLVLSHHHCVGCGLKIHSAVTMQSVSHFSCCR